MRHWVWMTAAVVVAACGSGAGAGGREALAEPACEPSARMDVSGRASPYDSTRIEVGDGVAKICYGRPSLRGRVMIGGTAVPFDTLWRTGANEPTIVHVNVPATIAGVEVTPGAYSLYTVPREAGPWTLIVNRSTSQWGHESAYTEAVRAQEVGRAAVEAETIDGTVEQLTIRPTESGGGVVLEWQNTRVRIPIEPA